MLKLSYVTSPVPDGPSLATSHGFNPTFWKLLWWDHLFVLFSDNFINHGVTLTSPCIHDRYSYMLPRVLCLVGKLGVYLICLPTEPLICIIYHYSSQITVVINSFSIQWIKGHYLSATSSWESPRLIGAFLIVWCSSYDWGSMMCVGWTTGVGFCSSGKVTTPVDTHGCTTEACG